jgi:putative chitinase
MPNAPTVTESIIRTALPDCRDPGGWASALNSAMQAFEINTKMRAASFLAQTAHESGHFGRLVEGLVYSTPARLMAVWPKRFPTEASAAPYVRNEAALANFVYANRMGNGDVASGDGFRFRGRGLIQTTGRSNYAQAAAALDLDLLSHPELLEQPANAARSAAFYWKSNGLNALADDETGDDDLEDFTTITKKINGGTVGLQERFALFQAFSGLLT